MFVSGIVSSCTLRSVSHSSLPLNLATELSAKFSRSCCVSVKPFCSSTQTPITRRSTSTFPSVVVLQDRLDANNSVVKCAQRMYATMRGGYGISRKVLKPMDEGFKDVTMDESMYKLGYDEIDSLAHVDEKVKRLFTLEYATNREIQVVKRKLIRERVRRHDEDRGSHEVQIAYLTLEIRNLSNHLKANKKDMKNKRRLLAAIDRRNILLGYLRRSNYERFEFILKELGLTYRLPPSKIIKLSKREMEIRSVTRKAYYDRKLALYEYFKRKLDESDSVENEEKA